MLGRVSNFGRLMSHAEKLLASRTASSSAHYVRDAYLDISDFEQIKQIFTEWNRHELWLSEQKSTGKKFVVKQMNGERLWKMAQETGTPVEVLGSPEEEAKFCAETEVFLSAFMRKLAPEHSPNSVKVVTGTNEYGGKEYYVASEYEPDYKSFSQLNIKSKDKFCLGKKRETRLKVGENPEKTIAIYGRIRTKLAIYAMVEWDSNPENIGVLYNPSRVDIDDDYRHKIFSIDHEAGDELFSKPNRTANIFENAKQLASGRSFSVYEFMELNHLDIAAREVVRKETIRHISGVFREQYLSPDLFGTKLSRDYSPDYQQKVYNIGANLQIKGATFSAANVLIENGWDMSDEHADAIFKREYGDKYKVLNDQNIWKVEKSRAGSGSSRVI